MGRELGASQPEASCKEMWLTYTLKDKLHGLAEEARASLSHGADHETAAKEGCLDRWTWNLPERVSSHV